jgi:hypothetical protein
MTGANQSLRGTQTYAFGVMTQSALLKIFINESAINIAKGGLAGKAAVALMTMSAKAIFNNASRGA